jgi:hypothetical protein
LSPAAQLADVAQCRSNTELTVPTAAWNSFPWLQARRRRDRRPRCQHPQKGFIAGTTHFLTRAAVALGLPAVALQAPAQAATTARSAAASTLGPWFTWNLDDNEPDGSDARCIDIPHGNIQAQAYQCNGGANQRWSQDELGTALILDPLNGEYETSEAYWFRDLPDREEH